GAAAASTEAVHEPGNFFERCEFKNMQAAPGAQGPGSYNFRRAPGQRQRFTGLAPHKRPFYCDWHPLSIIAKRKAHSPQHRKDGMIVGTGIDLEEVDRVKGAIERQGERFLKRIYTAKERAYCEQFKDKYERYAGRFAVKEAAMKALGTGWSRGVRWVDI